MTTTYPQNWVLGIEQRAETIKKLARNIEALGFHGSNHSSIEDNQAKHAALVIEREAYLDTQSWSRRSSQQDVDGQDVMSPKASYARCGRRLQLALAPAI